MDFLSIAGDNLLSPMVLCFGLGAIAALSRSELSIPDAAAKFMSIYLLFAIGMKGGVELAKQGLGPEIVAALVAGVFLSVAIPVVAYALMRTLTGLSAVDAAAAAGHYGSISIVTFVAATQALNSMGMAYDGYMVAVAAAMEAPAIMVALWLAIRGSGEKTEPVPFREILLNGSILLLIGALFIGWASGEDGMEAVSGFIIDPFKGVLCLFLLDMGLLAGRHLRDSGTVLKPSVIVFGLTMPLVGGVFGALIGAVAGMEGGSLALLIVLAASASYIAAPAALRVALPKANPAVYLTLSLGLTFPFNLTLGIPIYVAMAELLS